MKQKTHKGIKIRQFHDGEWQDIRLVRAKRRSQPYEAVEQVNGITLFWKKVMTIIKQIVVPMNTEMTEQEIRDEADAKVVYEADLVSRACGVKGVTYKVDFDPLSPRKVVFLCRE